MFAITEICGIQYKVYKGDFIYVPLLKKNINDEILLKKILLFINDNNHPILGTPIINNIAVRIKILENVKDNKIIIFKKKRRKGYKVKKGHRQILTKIQIIEFVFN